MNTIGRRLPLLIFAVPFLGFGVLAIFFAAKGKTFAQPLEKFSDVVAMGAFGLSFSATGLCAVICCVAGGTRYGNKIAALLMAGSMGFLGVIFLVVGVLDPKSIKSTTSLSFIGQVRWLDHFAISAVVFILCGLLLLWKTAAIYRITLKQLDQVG